VHAVFLAGSREFAAMDDDNPLPFLPCTDDAAGGDVPMARTLAAGDFAYDGTPLTLDAFIAYVAGYDFGPIAPSQLILHNTANPAASWAPSPGVPNWDDHEAGLSEAQIRTKRAAQLLGMKNFYIRKGWDRAFHLLVDERWIWLFTPMKEIGIHANSGNSYRVNGALRYSIGIEVVGRYATQRWPAVIIRQLRGVVGALSSQLGIAIRYTPAPVGQPAKHDKQLALHRDYTTEKDCPGRAIDPLWMTQVLAAPAPTPPPPPPLPPDPLRAVTLPGVDGQTFRCSVRTRDFYVGHGGAGLFGLALGDEQRAVGQDGRPCSYTACERVVIKTAAEGPHLALIEEFQAKGWA
jgi:hypothetical protein